MFGEYISKHLYWLSGGLICPSFVSLEGPAELPLPGKRIFEDIATFDRGGMIIGSVPDNGCAYRSAKLASADDRGNDERRRRACACADHCVWALPL